MVDVHNHLLPGLDDGSPDLDTSVRMAEIAVADGITHMVCTPHASNNFNFSPERIRERLDALRAALAARNLPLALSTGCDFHLSYDNLQEALAQPRKFTLNGTEYLLIELPDHGIPPTLKETFYELRIDGMVPILTHPERNVTLQRTPALLADWLRDGMLIQVTANSVTGGMGKRAQAAALDLLRKRWVHFLATDAHNTTTRPPVLSEAHALVTRKFGRDYADLLCTANPTAVIEGKPLPEQPEPLELYDDDDMPLALPWWKRLFGGKS